MPTYTDEQLRKIAGPDSTFLSPDRARELLATDTGNRPRVYGLSDTAPGILAYRSLSDLNRFPPVAVWVANSPRTVYSTPRKA